jgi:hypothetical protein
VLIESYIQSTPTCKVLILNKQRAYNTNVLTFMITSINTYMTREGIYKEKEEKTEGDFLKLRSSEKTNLAIFFILLYVNLSIFFKNMIIV